MTAADHPIDHPVELGLTAASQALGITREALRSRIRRGLVTARLEGGRWLVTLPGQDHGQVDRVDHAVDHAGLAARLATVEGERDWLRAEVERRGTELAEMRRLLGNAQQQLAALLSAPAQLPAPKDAARGAESSENAPAPIEPSPTPARRWWHFWG